MGLDYNRKRYCGRGGRLRRGDGTDAGTWRRARGA